MWVPAGAVAGCYEPTAQVRLFSFTHTDTYPRAASGVFTGIALNSQVADFQFLQIFYMSCSEHRTWTSESQFWYPPPLFWSFWYPPPPVLNLLLVSQP